jgi:hypothetical protein
MKYVVCGVIELNNESVLNQAVIEADDEETARGKYIMEVKRTLPVAKLPFWPVATSQEEIDGEV